MYRKILTTKHKLINYNFQIQRTTKKVRLF